MAGSAAPWHHWHIPARSIPVAAANSFMDQQQQQQQQVMGR